MRRKSSMDQIQMTVFVPSRRKASGFVAEWIDPQTHRRRRKTLGAKTKREAYDAASELANRIVSGCDPTGMSWTEFCQLYERQQLSRRSKSSRQSWSTTKEHVETLAPLSTIQDATTMWVSRWQEKLAAKLKSPNSVATYSARLRAAMRWAERQRLIDRAPYVPVEWEAVPASRAITGEEFDRILAAVKTVRPTDSMTWDRLLRGLYWSNLRIGELVRLSWDVDGEIRIEWVQGYPLIRKPPRSHKARKDRHEVILPQFWEACCETPPKKRRGLVFPVLDADEIQMSHKRVIKIIAAIGAKAGVLTNPDRGKTATSHDIGRRAFLPKIDDLLTTPEAHKAMGHAKFQTTVDYYDTREMTSIAKKLWGGRKP